MIRRLLTPFSWLVATILLVFTVRRWLFMLVALLPSRRLSDPTNLVSDVPSVLLLVPVRNEASSLPELLSALEGLVYPGQQLTVVFIDDASTDDSEALLKLWTSRKANWHLLSLSQNLGKAKALNAALAEFPDGEIIAIYDADERARPDTLRQLVRPFADDRVGAVSGRRMVSNGLNSPAASYTTFEGLVHQLITTRAKNRLGLVPAILGANCAYRQTALAEVGYFKPGALLEDSELTVKLTRAGWEIRFEPAAVSYHRVPETILGYWKQHTRWARGFNEVAKDQAGPLILDRRLSLAVRLELLLFSLGYLDRLALLAGIGLALIKNRLATCMVVISLLTPFLQIVAALKIGKAPISLWWRVFWLPFFFGLDIAMAVAGFWNTLRRAPQVWEERRVRE